MTRELWVPLLGLLWAIGPLRAQEVTGALEGRVVAESGDVIEGAEVSVEGAALQGAVVPPRTHGAASASDRCRWARTWWDQANRLRPDSL